MPISTSLTTVCPSCEADTLVYGEGDPCRCTSCGHEESAASIARTITTGETIYCPECAGIGPETCAAMEDHWLCTDCGNTYSYERHERCVRCEDRIAPSGGVCQLCWDEAMTKD